LYASQARLAVCLTSQTYVTDIETCQPRSTRLDLQRVLVMCGPKLLPYKPNWTLLLLLVKGAPLKIKPAKLGSLSQQGGGGQQWLGCLKPFCRHFLLELAPFNF